MARKNRNNQEPGTDKAKLPPKYQTAIYARLSVEDNGTGKDSIKTQIQYLKNYIEKTPGLILTSCFQDNGVTGTHFQRPGFQAMMEAAYQGRFRCIVVKDLSRFGRNYIETGIYLEQILPAAGIRFISVNDRYDSICAASHEGLALSLKNIAHDLYAKDISRKICTALEVKKKQGLFLGRLAPYGYEKSKEDIHHLEISTETGDVVREIFARFLQGNTSSQIAGYLNGKGVPPPSARQYPEKKGKWSGAAVLRILHDPVYCGYLAEHKTRKERYPNAGRRKLPPGEWEWVKGNHQAVIGREQFEQVQRRLKAGLGGRDKLGYSPGSNTDTLFNNSTVSADIR